MAIKLFRVSYEYQYNYTNLVPIGILPSKSRSPIKREKLLVAAVSEDSCKDLVRKNFIVNSNELIFESWIITLVDKEMLFADYQIKGK